MVGEIRNASAPSLMIRRATPEDAPLVAKVLHDCFAEFEPLYTPQGFAATILNAEQVVSRMREGPVWIALRSEEVLGTVAAVVRDNSLYIRGMAVEPKARGLRIGAALLDEVERYALKTGCGRMFLSTTPFLHSAIHLYEKSGFQRMNGAHDLFGTPLFMMEKHLSL